MRSLQSAFVSPSTNERELNCVKWWSVHIGAIPALRGEELGFKSNLLNAPQALREECAEPCSKELWLTLDIYFPLNLLIIQYIFCFSGVEFGLREHQYQVPLVYTTASEIANKFLKKTKQNGIPLSNNNNNHFSHMWQNGEEGRPKEPHDSFL